MHISNQHQHQDQNAAKKRRMDWETIDINEGIASLSPENKIPMLMNGKERERSRKISNGGNLHISLSHFFYFYFWTLFPFELSNRKVIFFFHKKK